MSKGEACCGVVPRRTAAERRACLIAAARGLFTRQGFHSTGMAQIAKDSKVLVGQIYRDFASKEDLMAAIVEQDLATMLDDGALCAAVRTRDGLALRAWVRDFAVCARKDDDRLYAEILAESQRNEKVAVIFRSCWDRLRHLLDVALEALAPGDEQRPARTRTAEVIMTLSGGMLHRRLSPSPPSDCGLAERVVELVEAEIDRLLDGRSDGPQGAGLLPA